MRSRYTRAHGVQGLQVGRLARQSHPGARRDGRASRGVYMCERKRLCRGCCVTAVRHEMSCRAQWLSVGKPAQCFHLAACWATDC